METKSYFNSSISQMATGVKRSISTADNSKGYSCEFLQQPPVKFFCKKCRLVAREPTLTSCCGEYFCKDCISTLQQEKRACPNCGEESFSIFANKHDERRISELQVFCDMKKRGCTWKGQLEDLEEHMESGECEFIDVPCPNNCEQMVQKVNLEQHLASECPMLNYTCPHCSFEAPFEVVNKDHWSTCPNFPISCPNGCDITCARSEMDKHFTMCAKVQMECTYKHAGCEVIFFRGDEEEHMEKFSKRHSTLLGSITAKKSKQFQKKTSLPKSETGSEKNSVAIEAKLQHLEREYAARIKKMEEQIAELQFNTGSSYWFPVTFTMPYFEELKESNRSWFSPTIVTHRSGYNFMLIVRPNGSSKGITGHGTHVAMHYRPKSGDCDESLKWPVTVIVTFKLLNFMTNHHHIMKTSKVQYDKDAIAAGYSFSLDSKLVSHEKLGLDTEKGTCYLKDNCLRIRITEITVKSH